MARNVFEGGQKLQVCRDSEGDKPTDEPAARCGFIPFVVAQIADGDLAHYPIELVLERRSGRVLVALVEAD